MLETRIFLSCDECGENFPLIEDRLAPLDAAIYTPSMLRIEAHEDGWVRKLRSRSPVDICAACAKKGGKG
jgi:hypothetical protein